MILKYWCWFIFDAVTVCQSWANQRLFTLKLTCCGTQVPLFKFRREREHEKVWNGELMRDVYCMLLGFWRGNKSLDGFINPEWAWRNKKCSCILQYIFAKQQELSSSLWNDIFLQIDWLLVSLFHIQPWLASGAAFACLQLSSALTHQWRWP